MNRFIIVLAVSQCASLAFAQNTNSGDIRGTATDASGAVIPHVAVTVQDVDKGVTRTYVTDGSGLYDTGSIVPDHYTITFTKEGFSTFVRGPITLQVQTLTIDGHLTVGSTTQTVQVTTDVPLLQTESGAQSTTLSEQELNDLPQVGASWENFVILMPGTSGTPTGGLSNVDPGQTASVNGNAVFYNVLGDGITMSLPSNGNSYDYNFDTLAEVKIVSNGFSAEYENGGVIYNQISKSGTSHFHGDVFEYFQNNALNAAPYSFGTNAPVPILRSNYFGGSIGGPVLRNKLFFFFNYDYSQNYGGSSNGFVTVPTAAMRTGDFTGQPMIYDPTTQTVTADGVVHRRSFADEYLNGNKIPGPMIDPVANAIQAYYPKPNVTGTVLDGITTNNYFYNVPVNSPGHALFGRADYDITSTNRLTITDFQSFGSSPQNAIGYCPIDCNSASNSAITAQVSDVWTFRPNAINEFHFGLSDQINNYLPQTLNQGFPAKLGLQFAKADLFPEINVTGGCCFELQPGTNAQQKQFMFEPSDVVTMVLGRHVLHFGGEVLAQRVNSTNWGNIDAGNMTYSGVYTASTQGTSNNSGVPYADFLLGQTQGWTAKNTPEFYPRYKTVQLFVQDDFKLRPNLTVTGGLRWEGWTGLNEKNGNELSFDPTVLNPATQTMGAMWYGTTKANGRTGETASIWDIFLPRLGFSWQPQSNMVVRGGVGLFAYNFQLGPNTVGQGNLLGSSGNETDATNGMNPVVLLNSTGDTNYQGNAGASINSLYQTSPTAPDAYNGQGVTFVDYHTPAQKIWQYNLEIQHELGPNMVANLAYVGSHGFDQAFGVDLNQVPEDKLGPNDASGPTNARPYPNFQSIGGTNWVGISNYNALQATIAKRLTSGLQFNFNYTWSKFLNESDACAWNCGTSTAQNAYMPSANYGPSDYDIRHMFKGRIIYQLPVGRGRAFLNNNYLLDEIIGGWQTAATIIAQTGNPFTPVMANNTSYAQSGSQYPNVIGDPKSGPHGTNQTWFNVNAFAAPAPGTFGNLQRDSVYGPGLTNVNFSLSKNFSVWREASLQIRADATNVLNHPSFGLPDTNIGPGHVGQITSVTVGGRTMQLLGRLSF
jgi:hypothetical protein